MRPLLHITFFSLLFGLSLILTLIAGIPGFRILPAESFEELNITPPPETTEIILPEHSINPGSINGIVTKGGRLIGGTSDDHWIEQSKITPYLLSNRIYRVYSKTDFLGEIQGSVKSSKTGDEPQFTFGKTPSPNFLKHYTFALTGGWDPFPRKPQYINENHDKYYPLVQKALDHLHVQAPVIIREIIQVDLAGDGTNELLITAEHPTPVKHLPNQGNPLEQSYSLILLYQVNNGLETGMVLIGSYQEPIRYEVLAVADFNGDWSMECLIRETIAKPTSTGSQIAHRDILLKLENKVPQKLLEYRWHR